VRSVCLCASACRVCPGSPRCLFTGYPVKKGTGGSRTRYVQVLWSSQVMLDHVGKAPSTPISCPNSQPCFDLTNKRSPALCETAVSRSVLPQLCVKLLATSEKAPIHTSASAGCGMSRSLRKGQLNREVCSHRGAAPCKHMWYQVKSCYKGCASISGPNSQSLVFTLKESDHGSLPRSQDGGLPRGTRAA
jgi:hypothetical protein